MDREKLRDIFRKYRAVGLVLLAGLLLLLLPTGKSSGQERQTSDDTQLYSLEETERRMAQLLGRMSGVGRVQVMLSLKTGPTLQLAQDMEAVGGMLDLNKREIITMALNDFLDKARDTLTEFKAWPDDVEGGL